MIWVWFVACTAVIVVAGSRLSRYGDELAERTGMGGTWIGVALLAAVTSLPELVTGVSSVTRFDLPNIAVGDVLGSCMLNPLLIGLLVLGNGRQAIYGQASQGHVLTGVLGILLLSVTALGIAGRGVIPALGWVGGLSFVLPVLYLLAMRAIFEQETAAEDKFSKEQERDGLRAIWMRFGVSALCITVAASVLPGVGESIADQTGLGKTFVGSVFIALSTSLPELVVSGSALRQGARDLAVGNVLGSNLFNLCILAFDDVLYRPGPLLDRIEAGHALTAIGAIAVKAVAILAVLGQWRARWAGLPVEAWMLWGTYGGVMSLLLLKG